VYGEPRSRFVASFVGLASFLPAQDLGGGRARTALGEVPFRGRAAAGKPLLLAARPEDLVIDPAGTVRGRAGRALYRGDSWLLPVEADGTRLLVRTGEPPERGSEVALRFATAPASVEDDGEDGA
jgi:iron(III) transport system ATP-binding protein